ncbi:hypothetical protein WK32_17135 [Burkholderia vietnamiensis]|nr:hypothetical protein WK32_17135 [Burkholderia vietnamiensis]
MVHIALCTGAYRTHTMLELIDWIRHGELIHKLSSPYLWLSFVAMRIAIEYFFAGLAKLEHVSGDHE